MTEDKYQGRPHPTAAEIKAGAEVPPRPSQREILAGADLSRYVKQVKSSSGGFAADYIPHAIIRSLLIRAQVDYDWHVSVEKVGNDWLATGTLVIRWDDGTVQTFTETSDLDGGPADASSRCFARTVAFATGLGLQPWEPKSVALQRTRFEVKEEA